MAVTPEELDIFRSESLARIRVASTNIEAIADLLATGTLAGDALKNAFKILATGSQEAETVVSFYRDDVAMPEDVRAALETMLQHQKDVLNEFVLKMALGQMS